MNIFYLKGTIRHKNPVEKCFIFFFFILFSISCTIRNTCSFYSKVTLHWPVHWPLRFKVKTRKSQGTNIKRPYTKYNVT